VNRGFPDSPEGLGIRQRYQWTIAALTAVAMLLAAWFARLDVWHGAIGPLLTLLFYGAAAYMTARRSVVPYAGPPEAAAVMSVDAPQAVAERPLPLPGGWLLQLGPVAVLAATAQWFANHHTVLANEACGFLFKPVTSFLGLGTLLCGIPWYWARATARGTRRSSLRAVRPTDAARRAALWFLLCAGYCAPLVLAAAEVADHTTGLLRSTLDVLYLFLAWFSVRTVVSACLGEYGPDSYPIDRMSPSTFLALTLFGRRATRGGGQASERPL
jgi:hypothetical protein